MGYGGLVKVIGSVDKLWKTIWIKAWNSQGFSVTLGRGGRVMRSLYTIQS